MVFSISSVRVYPSSRQTPSEQSRQRREASAKITYSCSSSAWEWPRSAISERSLLSSELAPCSSEMKTSTMVDAVSATDGLELIRMTGVRGLRCLRGTGPLPDSMSGIEQSRTTASTDCDAKAVRASLLDAVRTEKPDDW